MGKFLIRECKTCTWSSSISAVGVPGKHALDNVGNEILHFFKSDSSKSG